MDKNFNQNPNFGQNQNLNQNPNFNQYRNYGYVTTMRSNSSKQRIRSLILLICFTLTILITSVYAWFSTQKNVSLNNIKGKVEVAEGLQISLDAETWNQEIKFGEDTTPTAGTTFSNGIISDWSKYDIGTNNVTSNNIRPYLNTVAWNRGVTTGDETTGYMLPVSCSGVIGSTSKTLTFYTGTYSGTQLSKIAQQPEVIEAGFYAFDVYLMNTTKGNAADTLYLNQDSVVREIKTGTNTDYGLKNCIRVGLAFYDDGGDTSSASSQVIGTSATKTEILNKMEKNANIKKVAIWEPNYDTHSEYVMKQNARLDSLAVNETKHNGVATKANALTTYAVSSIPTDNVISNVYNGASTGLTATHTIKTLGEVTTVDNEEGEEITANTSGILPLTDQNDKYVQLTANSISKVRVYIWIEGQDPDCINWASHSDGVDVTVGLIKTSAGKKFKNDATGKCTDYATIDGVYENT